MGTLKTILVFAIGLMLNLGFGQEEEIIEWQPGKKLTWADFKGKPSNISNAAAITASGITYSFSAQGTADKMELDFTVSCHFYPNKSWYKHKLTNSTVLSHEQLHFDITEVYARKMRQELAKAKFNKNAKSQVKVIYRNVLKELNDFQNKYDSETNYSRDTVQQLIWNKRIKKALNN
ncbi:DUF922 domain-containing protein [Arenibacter sp. TNZ]|jgi:hypothetical protein|uniref:DUF922 domain-containing protein n=1 Tax=Arenibacter TaxID=178469 RepID=UPI000CD3BFA0|nr:MULTISPECIES: DUF922 domain-containing protein [Arenibacter]MCM4169950.1 DUF922 domain-containing protein [Arenibacter sp. TNZ]